MQPSLDPHARNACQQFTLATTDNVYTFIILTVKETSSPSTSLRKMLLNDKSMMRESSSALATNWPIMQKICVRFLYKVNNFAS